MRPVFPVTFWSGARATRFDGTNDFLTRGGDLTGNEDGKKFIVSGWFTLDDKDNAALGLYGGQFRDPPSTQGKGLLIWRTTQWGGRPDSWLNKIQVDAYRVESLSPREVLRLQSTTTFTSGPDWHHFLASSDQAIAGSAKLYIDDVDETNELEYQDLEIDFTHTDHRIAAASMMGGSPGWHWPGCLAHIYLNFAEYLDLSIVANRRKFINANGKPANLGADGSLPTSSIPIVYLRGIANGFPINRGSGGDFTVNGALADCAGP